MSSNDLSVFGSPAGGSSSVLKGYLGVALLAMVLSVSACECADTLGEDPSASDTDCVDADGDGFGVNCDAGPDCNDFNPNIVTCDCAEGNFAGCPCVDGETEACFDGVPEQNGVGQCRGGMRRCEAGTWSPCVGQSPPLPEICDDKDNDCDGISDEDLPPGPCGTCDPLCEQDSIGRGGDRDWGVDEQADGVIENPEGGLELPDGESSQVTYLFAANSEEGTVSKIDTETGREIARYVSALQLDLTMPIPLTPCPRNSNNPLGNCPSRTAVDLVGNVWVANRTFLGQGSVTKIAHRDCVDKNGNGTIDTSSDVNGNGIIDIFNSDEFKGEDDECILFTTKIGGRQAIPRALAIDPFAPVRGIGSVWVGAYSESRYYQLDASNGNLLRTVDVPHTPYGAVIDRFGVLWSIDLGSSNQNIGAPRGLVSIVSQSEPAQVDGPFPIRSTSRCAGGYGITLDISDNIWVGGFACQAVHRYTPSDDSWFTVELPNGTGYARGVATDRNGWVYVGSSHDIQTGDTVGHITRFRHEDGSQLNTYRFSGQAQGTIGVGLDNQDRVWGINEATGSATRIDPNTGTTEHFPVGTGPYTYSDFTGYTLQNITAPQGTYRRVFNGCPQKDSAEWLKVVWEADTPIGTGVEIRVKSAFTIDELVTAPYFGPFTASPADLTAAGVPDGKFIEVEVTLTTDTPGVTPTLWGLDVIWRCPPVQ